jgi:hypothetical protein
MQRYGCRGGRRRRHDSPLWRAQCAVSARAGRYWACLGASSLANAVRVSGQGLYHRVQEGEREVADMVVWTREKGRP